jgi:hypothetical protein
VSEIVLPATDFDLISFLKAIPDVRMRRGIRIPAWYLLTIVEMTAAGTRDGRPLQAQQLPLTSLRTTPEALLHEDARRYRGNGAGALASLRTAALNLLRLAGFQSNRAGMQAVMHDITVLPAMAMRQPEPKTY